MISPDRDCGCALVLIYGNGLREAALLHPHDGGEPYMVPVLRKAVQYARTHYEDGNIREILLSEPDMRQISDDRYLLNNTVYAEVRHVYYVEYKVNARAGKKSYLISALHFSSYHELGKEHIPTRADRLPDGRQPLVGPT